MDDALAADLASTALAVARRFHARRHHVVRRAALGAARAARRGRVRAPGDRRQARAAGGRVTGPDLVAAARISVAAGRRRRRRRVRGRRRTSGRSCAGRRRGAPRSSGSAPGPGPDAGAADHVLWLDDADPLVPATGRFVLLYHLLWELTHVCFEHPGLLTERRPTTCDRRRGVHHLLRRGAARRGAVGPRPGAHRAGVEDVDDDAGRPGRAGRPRCSSTPGTAIQRRGRP